MSLILIPILPILIPVLPLSYLIPPVLTLSHIPILLICILIHVLPGFTPPHFILIVPTSTSLLGELPDQVIKLVAQVLILDPNPVVVLSHHSHTLLFSRHLVDILFGYFLVLF